MCNRPAIHTACHSVDSVTHTDTVCRHVIDMTLIDNLSIAPSPTQLATLTLCTVCSSVTLCFRSLCHSACQSVCSWTHTCRSVTHTTWRSATHILSVGLPPNDIQHRSAALPLTCYLSFCAIIRSVTRTTCRSRSATQQTHCSLSNRQASAPSHATALSFNFSRGMNVQPARF